ncbi:hypothetical protein CVV38_04190 [Candidatus Peregrinibacteria bacterium HGW-Peregrinibacteria-1]|jgi:hypothetical protein|nr:MAG: hypothetical protein CVV38_04190 [Candidatus Peregrinibacteria bacterium HGW-Peregrinibacteria-1]
MADENQDQQNQPLSPNPSPYPANPPVQPAPTVPSVPLVEVEAEPPQNLNSEPAAGLTPITEDAPVVDSPPLPENTPQDDVKITFDENTAPETNLPETNIPETTMPEVPLEQLDPISNSTSPQPSTPETPLDATEPQPLTPDNLEDQFRAEFAIEDQAPTKFFTTKKLIILIVAIILIGGITAALLILKPFSKDSTPSDTAPNITSPFQENENNNSIVTPEEEINSELENILNDSINTDRPSEDPNDIDPNAPPNLTGDTDEPEAPVTPTNGAGPLR